MTATIGESGLWGLGVMAKETKIDLPALAARPLRLSAGVVSYVLRKQGSYEIDGEEEVKISPRRLAPRLRLKSNERVILISKKKNIKAADADGVLISAAGEGPQWMWHRLSEECDDAVEKRGFAPIREAAEASWHAAIRFQREETDGTGKAVVRGLRPPQLGALHAIGAHWSLSDEPATVVMPTGTGKTETMLAAQIAYMRGPILVVVPSIALRTQTVRKFLTLGLLRALDIVPEGIKNPVVGVLKARPKTKSDLEIFDHCNVIVANIATVAQGVGLELLAEIAAKCSHVVIDEAHHVAAESWLALKAAFGKKRILQFTATPFRRDGKPVDGKIIYTYPLHRAQQDGYFKPINFRPVFELDEDDGDLAIAQAAIAQLETDLKAGFDHVIMARCADIKRAGDVYKIYAKLAKQYDPILVHSEEGGAAKLVEDLRAGRCRIVVCVNMLGEGFDLPQLKIAAVHDTHKSLAVMLQFTGRFTRSAGAKLGDATVIANIAVPNVSTALERLYEEDADWNKLLREFSSKAAQDHQRLLEFIEESQRLDTPDDVTQPALSAKSLLPKFSAVAYRCQSFMPKRFHEGLPPKTAVTAVWLNAKSNTLYFVVRAEPRVEWTRSKAIRDRQWHLFVVYFNPHQNLLYIHSTDRESLHQELAKVVSDGTAQLLAGDGVFRALGGISRLAFQNIGLKRPGRRNLRYSMYTGADVATALSPAAKSTSTKSNVFGSGFERGERTTIGCSYKGRVWSKDQGPVQRFLTWCDGVGAKLIDSSINTEKIIDSVLIPREVDQVPEVQYLSIDWPDEFLVRPEDSILIMTRTVEYPLSQYSLDLLGSSSDRSELLFRVRHDNHATNYSLKLGGPKAFEVTKTSGEPLTIRIGRIMMSLEAYFSDYPPSVIFVDGSELDGNLLLKPEQRQETKLPDANLTAWNWSGTDITKESQWKDGALRVNSIQYRAAQEFQKQNYTIVFDDDGAGEAADLVCIAERDTFIDIALVHCKYTSGSSPGERVKDVVEVSNQAIRSSTWVWRFSDLCRHLLSRELRLRTSNRPTRFVRGDARSLNKLARAANFKPVKASIIVIQPGVSKGNVTAEQGMVLAAAHGYLLETVSTGLHVITS